MIKNLEYEIQNYIESPELYWPNDNIFDNRNIDKIVKHRNILLSKGTNVKEYAKEMVNFVLHHRLRTRRTAIYLQSCGGSGCHFLGDLIGSSSNAEMINEVYFPDSVKTNNSLIDFVNIFHSSKKTDFNEDAVIVNTGHLRFDFNPNSTKLIHENNLVVCLIRHPKNVVISLALRKKDYRQLTSAGSTDIKYFENRCRHVLKFHKEIKKNKFDDFLFYESFVNMPKASLKSFFLRHDIKFNEQDVDGAIIKNDSIKNSASGSLNFNSEKRTPLSEDFNKIYFKYFLNVVKEWGYE